MSARRHRVLIPGPVLLGFGEIFDRSYGRHDTPRPYPKVTPSCMGEVLLPFPCPHCNAVRSAVVDRKTRLGYYDKNREFSWCPACRGRYVINPTGTPLVGALPEGATCAPALVERRGKTEVLGLLAESGLDVLGVV